VDQEEPQSMLVFLELFLVSSAVELEQQAEMIYEMKNSCPPSSQTIMSNNYCVLLFAVIFSSDVARKSHYTQKSRP
jgi:hypothetical protein